MTKSYDVLIIGGGVIGASCAYECSKSGLKVALIEKRHCGSGASGSSAAMLELQIDAHRGDPFFSLAQKSRSMFPHLAHELKDLTGRDIEYEDKGILQLALNPSDQNFLEQEVIRQSNMGLKAQWMNSDNLQEFLPILNPIHLGGALFLDDGQVNGEILTAALIDGAKHHGAEIIDNQNEIRLLTTQGNVSGVATSDQTISGAFIVVAAGAWTDDILKPLNVTVGVTPVRGQLLVYDTPQRFLPTPIYTRSGGYITPKSSGFTLVGTTVEHVGYDESTTEKARIDLQKTAVNLIPNFSRKTVRGISAGLRPASIDGLPFIGPLDDHKNLLVASGHYRNGILLAPISGHIINALIQKQTPAIDPGPFRPMRHHTPTLGI